MKYTLKKKFHPNQVEEVGHVFEEIEETGDFRYQVNGTFLQYCAPHEIALLLHAGFLEIYDEDKPKLTVDKEKNTATMTIKVSYDIPEQKIELWTEKLTQQEDYWFVSDCGNVYETWWNDTDKNNFHLKTQNCHKTKESAELSLQKIKSKYEIEQNER